MSKARGVDTIIQTTRAEQRKHPRRPVNLSVRIFWQGESKDLVKAPGLVRDISANGFGIVLGQSLPKGKLLSVETTAGALQGIVRHVRQRSEGWILGMEILSASDGSDHQRSLQYLEAAIADAEASPLT